MKPTCQFGNCSEAWGGSYEDAAQVLEATWNEEEETKKEVSKQLKKIYDKRRKKEDVRKELEELSKEYQARVCTFEIFTFCFFLPPSSLGGTDGGKGRGKESLHTRPFFPLLSPAPVCFQAMLLRFFSFSTTIYTYK